MMKANSTMRSYGTLMQLCIFAYPPVVLTEQNTCVIISGTQIKTQNKFDVIINISLRRINVAPSSKLRSMLLKSIKE